MNVGAGELRQIVAVQSRAATKDAAGQRVVSPWSTVCAPWARIRPLGGRELEAAKARANEVTHEVLIRYRTGLKSDMRVLNGASIYTIHALFDPDGQRIWLQLLCSEGLQQG